MDLSQKILIGFELRKRLNRALRRKSSWGEPFGSFIYLVRELEIKAFLFGGTVRDLLLLSSSARPRDLDIVVDKASFSIFSDSFPFDSISRNSFGGLKCKFKALDIDIWPLEETWAFRQGMHKVVSFDVLPSTAFFNLDGIVAEMAPGRGIARSIYDGGFFNGIVDKLIDINGDDTKFPEVSVIRSFVLARSTGFSFSNRLCRFLAKFFDENSDVDLEAVQLRHYKRIRIDQSVILSNIRKMRRFMRRDKSSAYLPIFLKEVQEELCFEAKPWFYDRFELSDNG